MTSHDIKNTLRQARALSEYKDDPQYSQGNTWDDDDTPIRRLVVTFDIPHEIANKLIGRDEEETTANIDAFMLEHKLSWPEPVQEPKPAKYYGVPYGYQRENGGMVEDGFEQRILTTMYQLMDSGYTYHGVSKVLNEQGVPTKSGRGEWRGSVIKAIVDRLGRH